MFLNVETNLMNENEEIKSVVKSLQYILVKYKIYLI
jgi:hypothetical protein